MYIYPWIVMRLLRPRVLYEAPTQTSEYWRGIAMSGMFNTGATTRHGEMVGFNR